MPSDLSNYLATHYLIADPKPSKKRKRKQKDDSTGLIIADETESGWTRANRGENDDDDENGSAVVAGTSAEFRRAKKSAWKPVGGSASSNIGAQAQAQDTEAAREADAILASAAAETAAAAADEDASDAPAVMMSDGTHAGLQSASAVAAQLEARRRAEREEYEREGGHKKGKGGEVETIYRDATGRRVDVSMKRAELRREAAEAAAREAAKTEALRGEVQIEAARRRREDLEDAKVMTVARHADDEDMNREMKEQVRWGDSMAQFIEPKGAGGGGGKTRKIKGKPTYQGAWTPNRYGIRPGYRWDGVDRGNGFEAERFKAINRRERNKGLEYSWQMDE